MIPLCIFILTLYLYMQIIYLVSATRSFNLLQSTKDQKVIDFRTILGDISLRMPIVERSSAVQLQIVLLRLNNLIEK